VRDPHHDPSTASRGRTFGILSTFPPTPCGIATFSAALSAGLVANGATVDVVRCGTGPGLEDALVVAELGVDGPGAAIDALNRTDVAIIQHEYGIYDGPDGAAVLAVLAGLDVPVIVVAHTVPCAPTERQRDVLERICDAADSVVVMTETARTRLCEGYDVVPAKVTVIAHGAATPPADETSARSPGRNRLLTWGLLGPGKGIEWAIDALASLRDIRPRPEYVIAGATHPKVQASDGEAYRDMLIQRAWSSGAAPYVTFDDDYRDLVSLTDLIVSADLVVLPYDSRDQVTSGVLVDAVAAGRPVIATAFPHAEELLASGAGLVVPRQDPQALADAIHRVLSEPGLLASMAAEARRLAPQLSWTSVAGEYTRLADRVLGSPAVAVTA
jgi:glycosyltransferase involved in cell wall biosynthesis